MSAIDFEEINAEAIRIGLQTYELWRGLVKRAQDEINNRPTGE